MIIVSPSSKLEKTIGGIAFICNPPVGEIEIRIMKCLDNGPYKKARNEVDAELKTAGKSNLSPKAYEKLVREKITALEENERYDGLTKMDTAIDIALCGWRGDGVPEFPADGRPSQYLPIVVKQELFSWYQEQFILPRDDKKN